MKTIPVNICEPSYQDLTLAQVQRRVNVYSQNTKAGWRVCFFPGLQLIGTVANNQPCRAAHMAPYLSTGVLYSVHSTAVYRTDAAGTSVLITGAISAGTQYVEMCSNEEFVIVINGVDGYYIDIATDVLTQITDVNFPASPFTCAYAYGRFIVGDLNTGTFWMSQLSDPTTWTPIIFATAETVGDSLSTIVSGNGRLHLLGSFSYEQFYPGQGNNPFEHVNGGDLDIGTDYSAKTAKFWKGSLYFKGSSSSGDGCVYRIIGGALEKISTIEIEQILQGVTGSYLTADAFSYRGQDFYRLAQETGICLLYNITSDNWSELESNVSAAYVPHRAAYIINTFSVGSNPPMAFDRYNGNVYKLTSLYNSENGVDIRRIVDFSVDHGMDRTFQVRLRIQADVRYDATGGTLSASLTWSDDGGLTYNTATPTPMTKVVAGASAGRIILVSDKLGLAESDRQYRLTFIGPAAEVIIRAADMLIEKGTN